MSMDETESHKTSFPNNSPKVEGWLIFGDTHFGEDSGWGATGCTGRVCLAASFIRLICLLWNISCTSLSFCRTFWALAYGNKADHELVAHHWIWEHEAFPFSHLPLYPSSLSIHMHVIAYLALYRIVLLRAYTSHLIVRGCIFPPLYLQHMEHCQALRGSVQFSSVQSLSSVQFSHSVVSDFLRPHESQHARAPCPSPTPGVY